MKPTVGRIVHYYPTEMRAAKAGAGPWAALVTFVAAVSSYGRRTRTFS